MKWRALQDKVKLVLRFLFAVLFVAAGVLHLRDPAPFVRIVPPLLPAPLAIVYLSGIAEMVLGAALLHRQSARAASWGLVALLIAVFPANIYAALASTAPHPPMEHVSPAVAWLRLLFQPPMIAAVWWIGRRAEGIEPLAGV